MRMFAYHLCETPPVERTADAFEAHSVSVVVPPTATTYVRVRTSDYSNAPGSLPGFDTHRGPARGLASVDGRAEGGWARTAAGHTALLDHGATISANSWRGLSRPGD